VFRHSKHPALSQTSRPHKTRTAARASLPKITMSNSEPPGVPAAPWNSRLLFRADNGCLDPIRVEAIPFKIPMRGRRLTPLGFPQRGAGHCLSVTRDKDGPAASHRPVPGPYIGTASSGVQGVFDASVSTA